MQIQGLDDEREVEHLIDKIGIHVVLRRIKSGVKSRVWDVGVSSLRGHTVFDQSFLDLDPLQCHSWAWADGIGISLDDSIYRIMQL